MSLSKKILSGSLVLLFTFNFFNLLNLIYSLTMVRALSIADFGVLSTLTYFIIIFAIFSESIQTVISKYTIKEKSLSKIKNLLLRAFRKGFIVATFIFLLYLIIGLFLSLFLNIEYWLIAITGVGIYSAFTIPITRGALQGLKLFQGLGNNMILEGMIKLLSSIFFVYIGWRVYGAIVGIIFGSFIAFIFSIFQLKKVLIKKEKNVNVTEIYDYTKPVFLATFAIILFISLDIILAKRFFSAEVAGIYAIASTIAKIIFVGTQPISRAMFPLATEAKDKSAARKVFINSLKLVSGIVIFSLFIILIFPDIIISLFAGRYIPQAAEILFNVSLAMGILSISNLVILYNLSRDRTVHAKGLLLFIIIQIVLLFLFHSSLIQFAQALLWASIIFLISAILLGKR